MMLHLITVDEDASISTGGFNESLDRGIAMMDIGHGGNDDNIRTGKT